ncbi:MULTISPECIES: DUF1659 domain-containing protein [Clostridium]|uniref:DUF1659 domain-containing protein n=1 Tax=Clostridium TaxID=1485 RepID=UPI00100B6500|nr:MULTISPECIES: DUF1659 domain-containing protein [Clostridium]MBV1820506.1 DUF1659 domain-containing protein [Bacteroidales bacterium MSK.15.36]NSJ92475.1 DUF1659 domain-containing protein [Coprococcus sp. MSK.21.13]MCG4572777.1 DUF1659 domain-containing protein [Clostridium cochlearium]MCG4580706.1 DUF1659 domain-containing protein [Clostridium cochlearium]RXM73680.1 hypothetical protein DP154_13720 [Clostridium tetani]
MAITKDIYSTSLVLELDLGLDEKGKQKRKNKSLFKLDVLATDEDVYAIGQAAAEVLKDPMVSISRINKNLLLGE